VSTPIINTVYIGYFAKIPPIFGILACVFSSVIFGTISATSLLVTGGINRQANEAMVACEIQAMIK